MHALYNLLLFAGAILASAQSQTQQVRVSFSIPAYERREGQGRANVCLQAEGTRAESFTVDVTAQEMNPPEAIANEDFVPETQQIIFTPSDNFKCVQPGFQIEDDSVVHEPNERFIVTLSVPDGVIAQPPAEATVTIIDNDNVRVSLERPTYSVSESDGSVQVCAITTTGSSTSFDVSVTASESGPVSARDGMDFIAATRIINFGASLDPSRACTTFDILNDEVAMEGDESFSITLQLPPGSDSDLLEATVVITDNDELTVEFDPESYLVNEGGQVTLVIVKRGEAATPISVTLSTQDGTATVTDNDYEAITSQTVTFLPDEMEIQIQVNVLNDLVVEGQEMFRAVLGNPSPLGVILGRSTAEVTINDVGACNRTTGLDLFFILDSSESVNFVDSGNFQRLLESVRDIVGKFDIGSGLTQTRVGVIRFALVSDLIFDLDTYTDLSSLQAAILGIPYVPGGTRTHLALETLTNTFNEANGARDLSLEIPRAAIIITDGLSEDPSLTAMVAQTVCESSIIPFAAGIGATFTSNPLTIVPGMAELLGIACGNASRVEIAEDFNTDTLMQLQENITDFACQVEPQCPDPPALVNGMVTFTGNSIGDTATYTCNTDFKLIGNATATCGQVSGDATVFSPAPPECRAEVEVEFEFPTYTVTEDEGSVVVCLVASPEITDSFIVDVTVQEKSPQEAVAGQDFVPETKQVLFTATGGNRVCTTFTVADDSAVERTESFNAVFSLPDTSGAVPGSIVESCITIIDNDRVSVEFDLTNVVVMENDNIARVCLRKSTTTELEQPLTVEVQAGQNELVDNAANAVTDFVPVIRSVTFQPNQEVSCVDVPIIDDEIVESIEFFLVEVSVSPDMMNIVTPGPIRTISVTIIDNDDEGSICSVKAPLMVFPFSSRQTYVFRGTCEHILVTPCSDSLDFAVTVDFSSTDLSNGRIGVRYEERRFVYHEDGMVYVRNTRLLETIGNTRIYEDEISVTEDENGAIIRFSRLGVTVTASSSCFQVNVSNSSLLQETCGLCGTADGILLHSDGLTVANPINSIQVAQFANSYIVPTDEQILRSQRGECGAMIADDSVVADPLYSFPFLSDGTSLCFEMHGAPNQFFNLVSDTCTNVNALYSPGYMRGQPVNVISQIGIRAVGNSRTCYNIKVSLDGCKAFIDGEEVNVRRKVDGIRVRKYKSYVRITVPNCENIDLVMSVTCTAIEGQRLLRFDISRGLNLHPTSHGLLGQFWNIPITYGQYRDTDDYIITVNPANGSPPRQFIADKTLPYTWDLTRRRCMYVGNSQGGPGVVVDDADDSVIEGHYTDYRMAGLFEHQFKFSEFEAGTCHTN